MAKQFLIIDGYNLMHAAGLARPRYGPGDLERSRNRLLRFLKSALPDDLRRRTTIVFDAWEPPPGLQSTMMVEEMTVIYAVAPGEADAEIEKLIAAHSAPKQLTVVSSDRRLQQAAARRKARAIDSETWHAQWESRKGTAAKISEALPDRKPEISEEEVEYWLDIFDDLEET